MRAWLQNLFISQPLVPVALAFVAGIVTARFYHPGAILLLGALAVGFLALWWKRPLGIAILLGVTGATLYWARYEIFSSHDLRVLVGDDPRIVTIRGKLSETPQVREVSSNEFTSAALRVSEIKINQDWEPVAGEIMTRTRGVLEDSFFETREVEISGVLKTPARALAPGLFDPRNYLYHKRIFHQLTVETPADWRVLRDQPLPWIEKLRRWAKNQLARGLPEDEHVRILWAMTLGWRSAMSGEMSEPFMRTGTLHIIAVSGLHVTCIAAMLLFTIPLFGVPRHRSAASVVPLIWVYTFLTGWQSSGVRAAIMSTALIIGWSIKRPTALLNSTAAAGLLVLVFRPEQLFQAGFQLSFSVVISIALLTEQLASVLSREWRDDPYLPRALWPAWRNYYNRVMLRYIIPSLVISSASFLGSLPLTAYYFNLFSPISLLANLVVVPLSSLALVFSMATLVLPFLHASANPLSWSFTYLTVWFVERFEDLGGFFYVPKPGVNFFLLYVSALFVAFTGLLWRKETRVWSAAVVVALGGLWFSTRSSKPIMHILPYGGMPVLVDFPGREDDLLIDCSDDHGFEFGVKRFLRTQGFGNLPSLLLTHGDVDHLGGFVGALSTFQPSTIFTSPHDSRSSAHKSVIRILAREPDRWNRVRQGDSAAGWTVLHPPARKAPRAEDNALILRRAIDGWRVLIIPDLGQDTQRSLMQSSEDFSAELLVMGVPENGEPPSIDLITRISPKVVVLGTAPPHVRNERLIARFNLANCIVFDAGTEGAVKAEFEKASCRISSVNGKVHDLYR